LDVYYSNRKLLSVVQILQNNEKLVFFEKKIRKFFSSEVAARRVFISTGYLKKKSAKGGSATGFYLNGIAGCTKEMRQSRGRMRKSGS
jgi:hypothetical protein